MHALYSVAKRSLHGARAGLALRLRFHGSEAIGHRLSFPLLQQHGGSTYFKYALHKRQHRNISRIVKGRVHARAQMIGITSRSKADRGLSFLASGLRVFCGKRPLRSHYQGIALPYAKGGGSAIDSLIPINGASVYWFSASRASRKERKASSLVMTSFSPP